MHETNLNQAYTLASQNNLVDAIALLDKAQDLFPNSIPIQKKLCELLTEAGCHIQAHVVWDKLNDRYDGLPPYDIQELEPAPLQSHITTPQFNAGMH